MASVDRGRYGCLLDHRTVTAMRARELGRRSVVVGDQVALAGDISGAPGTLARIVRVEPRKSVLRRSADDTDPVERVIVANADQLVIVTALADPPPRPRLIDRFLVAAFDAGLSPLLVLTKSDLAPASPILDVYGPLGIPHLVLGQPLTPARLDPLREALAGRVSVLVGHSGVGKSTLVNALIPGADRAVGTVSPVTGRGRHTSSSAVALPLPPPGRGLAHRHPGTARVRPGSRRPGAGGAGLPRSGPGHAGLPARLHAPGAGLRARRLGPRPGRGQPAGDAAGLAAPPAAQPGRRRPQLTGCRALAQGKPSAWGNGREWR